MTAAKTAESRKKKEIIKSLCPKCGADKKVVQFVAMSSGLYPELMKNGFYWKCGQGCGYIERTR